MAVGRMNTSINDYDAQGQTPLIKAVSVEHPDLNEIKKLLQAGANPNFCDDDGNSPLHFAARNGHVEVAKILIDYNANPNLLNRKGATPKSIAEKYHPSVSAIFPQSKGVQKIIDLFRNYISPKPGLNSQTWITSVLAEFEYDNLDGYCHGFTNMANQAIQSGDIETFIQRIRLFRRYQPDVLREKVIAATDKQTAISHKYNNDPIFSTSVDLLENKLRTKNSNSNEVPATFDQILTSYGHTEAITYINTANISPDERMRRKKNLLINQMKQNAIRADSDALLTNEEKLLLTVKPFLDSITIHQGPSRYLNYLNTKLKEYRIQQANSQIIVSQDSNAAYALVSPVSLDGVGGVKVAVVNTVVCDKSELKSYLDTIANMVKNQPEIGPLTCKLSANDHAISVSYDLSNNEWRIIDINFSENLRSKAEVENNIANFLFAPNINNQSLIIKNEMTATESKQGAFIAAFEKLNENETWKNLTKITDQKLDHKNSDGTDWLNYAVRIGDWNTVDRIHDYMKKTGRAFDQMKILTCHVTRVDNSHTLSTSDDEVLLSSSETRVRR